MAADDTAEPPDDPLLEAELDRAIAPYRALLSPDTLRELRDLLGDVLTTHPAASREFNRARPRPPLQRSGTVAKEPHGHAMPEATIVSNTKGGKRG